MARPSIYTLQTIPTLPICLQLPGLACKSRLFNFYVCGVYLHKTNMKTKPIVITGCPRSGTRFASHILRLNGLDVGHEKLGKDGISSWTLTAGSLDSPCGPSFGHIRSRLRNYTVYHQVRHPLDVIASLHTITEGSWDFAFKTLNLRRRPSTLYNAMSFWYYWNLRAANMSSITYRVEDICSIFNLQKDSEDKAVNSRPHQTISLEMVHREDANLCSLIVSLAETYGYVL